MDQNDQSRFRYSTFLGSAEEHDQQAQQAASQAQIHATQGQPSYIAQQQAAIAEPSITRAGPEASQFYGFTQGIQFVGAPLQPQYGQQYDNDASRAQTQQFAQYAPGFTFPMPQLQTQQTQHQDNEPVRRFIPVGETFPAHFAEPQAAQYYTGAQAVQTTNAAFGSTQMASPYTPAFALTTAPAPPTAVPAAQPQPQPRPPVPQAAATPSLPSTMIDPMHHTTAYQAFPQQHTTGFTQTPSQQQQPMHHVQPEYHFARYQHNIRTVFTHVHNQSLREVPQPLLEASRFLLGGVESLGLTKDPEDQQDPRAREAELNNRIELWDEFNRAWLTTMQCQFDMMQELLNGQRTLHGTQSTLNHATIDQLGRELIGLADAVEKHGLVDYQMGVLEDEIIESEYDRTA